MIHPALTALIRLQSRGTYRRIFRGVKTLRGAIFFLVGVLWFCWMIGPQLLLAFSNNRAQPTWILDFGPIILMGLSLFTVLTGAGEKAFNFSPAEVNFLFTGPFSRRELLIYKILLNLRGILFQSLLFSLIFLTIAQWWIAAFLGFFLIFSFIYLFTIFFNLLRQIIAEYLYNRLRIFIGLVILGLIAVVLGQHLSIDLLIRFKDSWIFSVVLAPFRVFVHTISAATLVPDLLYWGAYALLIDLGLAAGVIYLDADYYESSMNMGQKLYALRQKQRRAGTLQFRTAAKLRFHIPRLPWLGGAGPIIWRQLTHAVRISGAFLFYIIFMMMMMMGIPMMMMSNDKNPTFLPIAVFAVIFLTILSNFFPYDFRSELEHIDWLKRLPISPLAIACGELVVPVLFISSIQFLIIGGSGLWLMGNSVLGIILLFCIPLNFLNFCIDNLLFLFFPARVMVTTPGDFQAFGRNLVMLMMKFILLLAGSGISAGMGFLLYWSLGGYVTLSLIISWTILILEIVTLIPWIAWAFERLDVSRDILA